MDQLVGYGVLILIRAEGHGFSVVENGEDTVLIQHMLTGGIDFIVQLIVIYDAFYQVVCRGVRFYLPDGQVLKPGIVGVMQHDEVDVADERTVGLVY